MTTNTVEPETEDTEPKFRTRAEAEAEIALLNEEIEHLQDLVKDDIERLDASAQFRDEPICRQPRGAHAPPYGRRGRGGRGGRLQAPAVHSSAPRSVRAQSQTSVQAYPVLKIMSMRMGATFRAMARVAMGSEILKTQIL